MAANNASYAHSAFNFWLKQSKELGSIPRNDGIYKSIMHKTWNFSNTIVWILNLAFQIINYSSFAVFPHSAEWRQKAVLTPKISHYSTPTYCKLQGRISGLGRQYVPLNTRHTEKWFKQLQTLMGYGYPSPNIYAYVAQSAHNKRTVGSTCRLSVRSYVNLSSNWTIFF
jgi:hypothetical protein